MTYCEITDSKTRKNCGKKGKIYVLLEADFQLRLCPKHFKIWDRRGTLKLRKELFNESR